MNGRDDIDFARLADWVEGRLPEQEARDVRERLAAADEETRESAAWLRAFVRVSRDTVLASPPPEVRRGLREQFEAYAESRRQPGPFRRLMASLTFDSGLQTALAGVRTAAVHGSQRQLVYSTDVADVALTVQRRRADEKLDLDGQILPEEDLAPGSFSVQLLSGTKEVGMTSAGDLGEFAFEAIAPGKYEMLLGSGEVEIIMSPIELHA